MVDEKNQRILTNYQEKLRFRERRDLKQEMESERAAKAESVIRPVDPIPILSPLIFAPHLGNNN